MSYTRLREQASRYYTSKVAEHGATARGVDWNSEDSQRLRFEQLLKVCRREPCSLLDYGCGYGALLDHLERLRLRIDYCGYDCAPAMIEQAIAAHPHHSASFFEVDEEQLSPADYVVASGLLNVKLEASDEAWHEYMLKVVDRLAALSREGFAFNALSLYSDPDRRQPYLHYADPLRWFDHCKRRISRAVTLLHDYPLFEFTILVRH